MFILVSLGPLQSLDLEQPLDLDRSLDSLLLSGEPYPDLLLRGDKDLFLCLQNLFLNSCLIVLAGCNVSVSSFESYFFPTHATLKSKLYFLKNAFVSSIEGGNRYYLDFRQSIACNTPGPKPGQY
ncbi:MAG: hypothetical protein EZS28_009880 [Streblomastix strix]|uniref:Uncharacterized protein n=1 Tax=Streblomastix strix TaxID=222440 RepID=A0A5J4WHZ9_9EUKA|nr:MAG: hypothetical protein EZS28_009880 [Streblomastix strix]